MCNNQHFLKLKASLDNYHQISTIYCKVIWQWIVRFDGFLFDMELLDKDETREELVEKTLNLLRQLDLSANGEDLLTLLSQEFEGLYYRAQYKAMVWNSLNETYSSFSKRVNSEAIHLIVDQPHASSSQVYRWLAQNISKAITQ